MTKRRARLHDAGTGKFVSPAKADPATSTAVAEHDNAREARLLAAARAAALCWSLETAEALQAAVDEYPPP